jgi:hypothetical protein
MAMPAILAALDASSLQAAGAGSWWRTLGGLLVVFGLLFLCLKLLSRYGRRGAATQARLLTVWHLGPRREIQVLRLGAEVSYVYRHENAMVLLRQEPWDAYVREHGEAASGPGGATAVPSFVARLLKATPLGAAAAGD